MANKQASKKGSVGRTVAVGVGVAALSAAAYLLFGPEGRKNRKKINGWAVKMKGEMIEKFEKMQKVTEPMYHKVVDEISAKYAKTKGVTKEEIDETVAELKKHWKALARDAKVVKKAVKKTVSNKSTKFTKSK